MREAEMALAAAKEELEGGVAGGAAEQLKRVLKQRKRLSEEAVSEIEQQLEAINRKASEQKKALKNAQKIWCL